MKFEATEQQVKEIALKAIENSKSLGLGYFCLPELHLKPESIEFDAEGCLYLDYVKGRCVKLFILRLDENHWEIPGIADPEHQTWARRYASNEILVNSVLEDGKTNTAGETIDDYVGEAILDRYVDPEEFNTDCYTDC